MKRISTLLTLAFALVFSTNANSQNVSQGFETQAEVNGLISSCWTFNRVDFSNSSPITGTGSMVSQLSTTTAVSEIITPFLVMPSSLTVSFNFNIEQNSGGNKKVQLLLSDGVTETKFFDGNLPNGNSFSMTFNSTDPLGQNLTGNKKVIIRISPNLSLKIDNLSINAPYTYAGGCAAPEPIILPVKLLSFQGSVSNNQSELQWSVAENETGAYFEIEKSTDGRSFTTSAIVYTTETQGNESYSYKESVQNGTYYRLKVVNKDGSVTYSKILSFKAQIEGGSNLTLLQNPIQESLSFSFTSSSSTNTDVAVYNLAGVKVYSDKFNTQKGRNSLSIKLNSYLSAGTYILEVRNNMERSIAKFLKH